MDVAARRRFIALLPLALIACASERPAPATARAEPAPVRESPSAREPTSASAAPAARNESEGLETLASGSGDRALVLLHGYGSNANDFEGFVSPHELGEGVRVILPQAPNRWRGGGRGRAWFEPPRSRMHEDEARTIAEVERARAALSQLFDTLAADGVPSENVVLGGFSQGAMMSLDFALFDGRPLAGLAILSGAPLPTWAARYERARDTPLLLTHGHQDEVLPFADAVAIRDGLRAAGAQVDWLPFDGRHTLPPIVRARLLERTREWLAR